MRLLHKHVSTVQLAAARTAALEAERFATQGREDLRAASLSVGQVSMLHALLLPNNPGTSRYGARGLRWYLMAQQLEKKVPPVQLMLFLADSAKTYERLRRDYSRLARFRRLAAKNLHHHAKYLEADTFTPLGLRAQLDMVADRLNELEHMVATLRVDYGYTVDVDLRLLNASAQELDDFYDDGRYGDVAALIIGLMDRVEAAIVATDTRERHVDYDQVKLAPMTRRIMAVERHIKASAAIYDDLVTTYGDQVEQSLAAGLDEASVNIQTARKRLDQVSERLASGSELIRRMMFIQLDQIEPLCSRATALCRAVTNARRQFERRPQDDPPQDQ